jgi:choloylglycine hydrolase
VNEEALAIEVLWLEETVYPEEDDCPTVASLQWIQYLLDNCANVEEALLDRKEIRIANSSTARVHFFLCDRSGACAAVEFLDGKTVVHTGPDLPVHVLTNDTYESSLDFLSESAGLEGEQTPAANGSSRTRFVRTSTALARGTDKEVRTPVEEAFAILEETATPEFTMWSIVYDLKNRQVYFRTSTHQQIRRIDWSAFEFSCSLPVRALSMNEALSGAVQDEFVPFTTETNRQLIRETYRATGLLRSIGEEVLENLARYPEGFLCTE